MKTLKDIFKRKLRNRRGESIAETLVATLIAALALTMLAGSIAAASNMIKESRRNLKTYYDNSNNMAEMSGGTSGTVSVSGKSIDVEYVENSAFKRIKVVAYKKA